MRIDLAEALFNAALVGGSGGGSVTVQPLSVSSNGTYSAPSGYAYSPVDVAVPMPSGTITLSANGTFNVASFESALVNVSGGGDNKEADIIMRTISGAYTNAEVSGVIGSYAFIKCMSLNEANFPNATGISAYAFSGCSNLSAISCPNVTAVGDYAFAYCTSLSSIDLPLATKIGLEAFETCSELSRVSLPLVNTVSSSAFRSCHKLVTIDLPSFSGSAILNSCFGGCERLTSVTGISGVTTVGFGAFAYASALTDAIFPSCTTVSASAFMGCSALSNTSFPELITIGSSAFTKCSSLRTISLPKCTTISANAFSWCASLYSVYLMGSTKVTLASTSVFSGTPIVSGYHSEPYGSVFVPSSLYATYTADSVWGLLSARIVSM